MPEENIYPDYNGGSIVNLMSSIQASFGAKSSYKELNDLKGSDIKSRNVVLFVIDGLGYDHVVMKENSFLRKNTKDFMTTVFPSTTAAAIPTFFTGTAPQEHGINGWYMYLKQLDSVILPLPFVTIEGIPLSFIMNPEDLFDQKPVSEKINCKSYMLLPEQFSDSGCTNYFKGKSEVVPFKNMSDLFKRLEEILKKKKRKYIYVYWPGMDSLSHHYGKNSKKVDNHFNQLDREVRNFSKKMKNTTMIITADHGHMVASRQKTIYIRKHKKLVSMLNNTLCGEPRLAYCHVKKGYLKTFEKYVKKNLSHACDIYKSSDVIKSGFFGLGKPNKQLRSRTGDFVLVMKKGYTIIDTKERHELKGNHGGLSREEMLVPLIVMKK